VVEYDHLGKECWRQNLPGKPTYVERLVDGGTLVALPEPGLLLELNRAGQAVWRVELAGDAPTYAQRLPNGNTLVCLIARKKVVEIDRKGQVVWQLPMGLVDRPHTAQHLDNGNVLVCDFGKFSAVTEFDRSGKIVWVKSNLNNPAQGQRLPNGNTLIATEEGLTEYNPQGNTVRRWTVSRSRFFAY
jgi:outer membrane protein assembly factor BamB